MKATEKIIMDYDEDKRMTGTEDYEILGNILTKQDVKSFLMPICKGLILTADCDKKANAVMMFLCYLEKETGWKISFGTIRVFSTDMRSAYGHDFNLPYEFHCWLENEKREIIDLALPGLIIRGSRAKDEVGYFLTGRTPVILAGEIPNWIIYTTKMQRR